MLVTVYGGISGKDHSILRVILGHPIHSKYHLGFGDQGLEIQHQGWWIRVCCLVPQNVVLESLRHALERGVQAFVAQSFGV